MKRETEDFKRHYTRYTEVGEKILISNLSQKIGMTEYKETQKEYKEGNKYRRQKRGRNFLNE